MIEQTALGSTVFLLACEQALLFGRVKRVARSREARFACPNRRACSQAIFLCSEFKLENIYSGVIFCGKICAIIFICGNLFFRVAGKTAKSQKIRTRKNFA